MFDLADGPVEEFFQLAIIVFHKVGYLAAANPLGNVSLVVVVHYLMAG